MAQHSSTVTIVDVARAAGVSKSAAARVLANKGSASERTRRLVLDAASELGYRPNQLAKAMKSGSTQSIGMVLPDVSNPFFSSVLRGFSDTARGAGFEIIIINTDNRAEVESRSLELLAEKRVDGIAIAPVLQDSAPTLRQLSAEGMPVSLIDRRLPDIGHLPLVSMHHAAATEMASRALLDAGHTRIAIITEATVDPHAFADLLTLDDHAITLLRPSLQRLIGHARALQAAGIDIDPDLVITAPYDSDQAEEAVTAFLRRDHGATAVHGTNAVLTYAAYRAFTHLEVSIPDDLSFIGFDDQDWMLLMHPAVTVISQAAAEIGSIAARTLLDAMTGAEVGDTFLSATLITRGSVKQRG